MQDVCTVASCHSAPSAITRTIHNSTVRSGSGSNSLLGPMSGSGTTDKSAGPTRAVEAGGWGMFTCHRLSSVNKLDCLHAMGTDAVSALRAESFGREDDPFAPSAKG
jgi:hypothetical protein